MEVHEEPHLDIIPALAIHAHLPRCPKVGDHFISRPKGIVGGKALHRCKYFQLVASTNGEKVTSQTLDHLGEIPPNTSFGPATAIRATPVGDGTSSVISVLVPYPRPIPGMASVLEAWVSITWHDTYLASLKDVAGRSDDDRLDEGSNASTQESPRTRGDPTAVMQTDGTNDDDGDVASVANSTLSSVIPASLATDATLVGSAAEDFAPVA